MPYNSKEWKSVTYRSSKLIGIKQHKTNNKKFMLEVNIKKLRKRKFITLDNKGEDLIREAIECYSSFRLDIKQGYFIEAKTFEDIFRRMLLIKNISYRWKKMQEATFKNHIDTYIGQKNIKDIRVYDIDEVMIKVKSKAPASKKAIMDIIKGVMRYAKEEKIIKNLPFEIRHNIKVNALQQKTLVTDAKNKFIAVHRAIVEIFKDDPTMRCIFLFGLYGRRKSEVLKMEWKHIDFINERYTIPSNNSKVKISFLFSLPNEIISTLKEIQECKRGLIFKNRNNNKRYTNLQKQIKLIRYASGWKDFTFHSMRNLLASNLHSRGVSSSYISSVLGHTNPNTIKQYLTMERIQPIIEEEINKTLYGTSRFNHTNLKVR